MLDEHNLAKDFGNWRLKFRNNKEHKLTKVEGCSLVFELDQKSLKIPTILGNCRPSLALFREQSNDGLRLIQNRSNCSVFGAFFHNGSVREGNYIHWRNSLIGPRSDEEITEHSNLLVTYPICLTKQSEEREAKDVNEIGLMPVCGIESALTGHLKPKNALNGNRRIFCMKKLDVLWIRTWALLHHQMR